MSNPLCPTDCDQALGTVLFDDCALNINPSEIQRLFVSKGNAELHIVTGKQASEWTTRIAQTGTNADAIRELTVIGDKPAASPITVNSLIASALVPVCACRGLFGVCVRLSKY